MRLLLFCCVCAVATARAQDGTGPGYPKGYFRNPLNIPMQLSGNFGELRSNHYHMGYDLKTQGRENLPVYAAADGYVGRVKIEPFGFGRAIYVHHPNGYTTVYAHLNNFNSALENWVKQQQYNRESWAVDLEVPPGLFAVKKGDFLAYSGNTGGSQAPHLHFEIRQTNPDVNLNPALFGFPISDATRPVLQRLAIYDRTYSTYEQTPRLLPLKAAATGTYVASPALVQVNTPKVSFAVGGYDTQSGSPNRNGIYEMRLQVDDAEVIRFQMDNISYNDTRYLNAHVDYKMKVTRSIWLQHLSELPGYARSIYKKQTGDGVIDISDGEVHQVRITAYDAAGNASHLRFSIRYTPGAGKTVNDAPGKMFYPQMVDGYETDDCEFYLGERCLYDSVRITYSKQQSTDSVAVSALHAIGAPYIPLHEAMLVRIKPDRVLTPAEETRTVMQWIGSNRKAVQKVEWQGGWAAARFREFGRFQLVTDTTPPVITPLGLTDGANLKNATRIIFTVKDNLGSIKKVRAELDGKWLRFTNDKGGSFIYRFDEHCPPGGHTLRIMAEDEAGNRAERIIRFVR